MNISSINYSLSVTLNNRMLEFYVVYEHHQCDIGNIGQWYWSIKRIFMEFYLLILPPFLAMQSSQGKRLRFCIYPSSDCKLIQLWEKRILILYENNHYIIQHKKNCFFPNIYILLFTITFHFFYSLVWQGSEYASGPEYVRVHRELWILKNSLRVFFFLAKTCKEFT